MASKNVEFLEGGKEVERTIIFLAGNVYPRLYAHMSLTLKNSDTEITLPSFER